MTTNFNPIQTNAMPRKHKILNFLWGMINSTLFRFTPPHLTFFRKVRVFLLKLFGADIDWDVSLHPKAKIEYPWNLSIRHMSSIGEKCWIYAMDHINIGEKTCIGRDVYLLTGSHNISSPTFDLVRKPIKIGDCCWITTGVTVLPGVSIENGCVVSVNSTVVNNVDSWSVVGGNPAKFIKKRVIKNA